MTQKILPCPFCPHSSLRVDHLTGAQPGESYDRVTCLRCGASNPLDAWNGRPVIGLAFPLRVELNFDNAMHSITILEDGKLDMDSTKRLAGLRAVLPCSTLLNKEAVLRLADMIRPVCGLMGVVDPVPTACRLASAYVNYKCVGCNAWIDSINPDDDRCEACGEDVDL